MVILGVGKNMVGAIRYWCETLALIAPAATRGQMALTELGQKLLLSGGWDPYLEDIATLWLLHWLLVRSPERASTWHLAFTHFPYNPFSRPQLLTWLSKLVENQGLRVSAGTLKRDVDVFLRTYVAPVPVQRAGVVEDSWDCPLAELDLIEAIGAGQYQMARGYKPSLPDAIFCFALLDFWQREAADRPSLSFERVAHGLGSPGQAFKLSENALVERLERLPEPLSFDETAGLRLILTTTPIQELNPMDFLEKFYQDQQVRGAA